MISSKASAPRRSLKRMVTPEFRKASSRRRCSSVFRSNSICEKVCSDGMKVIDVPVRKPSPSLGADPVMARGVTASPRSKRIWWV